MTLPSTPCVDAPSGQRAAQRVGRRAKRASCPAPDKRKGLPFGSPLLFPQRQGNHQCRIHARNHLEKQAPLLRGCPDRGGERQAKGGAHALPRNVWGDARNARRVPRQIKEKGCLSAALFFYLAERGGLSGASMHPTLPRYALQGQPTAVRFCSCRTVEPRREFSSPRIKGVDHYNNRLHLPNVGQEKSRPVGGFLLYLAERGGFEPPRRYKRLPDFESGTFNHSATSPGGPRRTGDAHHTRK